MCTMYNRTLFTFACCIQNTARNRECEGAEVLFYINDSLEFVMSRTRKRHGTFSSIVGKCASIRQIESVSQSMFSEEDHHTAKIIGLRREIQLIFFFSLFYYFAQWYRQRLIKALATKPKWKQKYCFVSFLYNINGRLFIYWKKKSVSFFFFVLIGESTFKVEKVLFFFIWNSKW